MSPKRVLIIEDDGDIRDSLKDLLEGEGYIISTAENGLVGLEKVKSTEIDVILLDLSMPVLDGSGFLKIFRQDLPQIYNKVPVYLVTAAGDHMGRVEGVKGTIRKPIDVNDLLSILENC